MTVLHFLLLFCLLQVVSATLHPKARGEVNGVLFAHFKKHPGFKLSGYPFKKFGVKKFGKCLMECVANTRCLSTNVYTKADARGLLQCELLDIDKYKYENNLAQLKGIDHYALPSTCASSPCQNNGTCVPVYANNSYVCECPPLKTGTHCEVQVQSTCASSPCQNSGTCVPVYANNSYVCECPPLKTGTHCELEKDCSGSFGMEDGRILDSMISASSFYNFYFYPYYGRLNQKSRGQGCWQPKVYQAGQYLQIDLGSKKSIAKVATQGRPVGIYSQWVTSFTLKYSDDGSTWTDYTVDGAPAKIFTGNVDKNTVKPNVLPAPFMARYVRVVIKTWYGNPSMRVELYGCN